MARRPDPPLGVLSPFGLIQFDHKAWLAQWWKRRVQHRALLQVDIAQPIQMRSHVSALAITRHPPRRRGRHTDLWSLCLLAEALTPATATRLLQTLALLGDIPGTPPTQALAFLLNAYLMETDQLRQIAGKKRSQLDAVAWHPFGPVPTRYADMTAMTQKPLWPLEALLTLFWVRPEHYVGCLALGAQDSSRRLEWGRIPAGAFPPEPVGCPAPTTAQDPVPAPAAVPDIPPALLALQATAPTPAPSRRTGGRYKLSQKVIAGFQDTLKKVVLSYVDKYRSEDEPEPMPSIKRVQDNWSGQVTESKWRTRYERTKKDWNCRSWQEIFFYIINTRT